MAEPVFRDRHCAPASPCDDDTPTSGGKPSTPPVVGRPTYPELKGTISAAGANSSLAAASAATRRRSCTTDGSTASWCMYVSSYGPQCPILQAWFRSAIQLGMTPW